MLQCILIKIYYVMFNYFGYERNYNIDMEDY